MKLVSYRDASGDTYGVAEGTGIIEVGRASGFGHADHKAVLAAGALDAVREFAAGRKADVALPIERNYRENEIIFTFGQVLHGPDVNLPAYQEAMFGLSEQAFGSSSSLDMSLGYALLLGLKKHGARNYVELDPHRVPAHVFRLRRRVHREQDFDYFM